ncbi:MAG: cation:proton antiporter subunit C [Thermodesulfovibrionales bacterium]|nr:cation:proton antiporter subunit C [Thermodesulfovibrionales bacterium]
MDTMDFIIGKYNYWVYIVLMMIGFYAMIAKNNFVKKLVGMNIFQTAIILYYISIASKKGGATIPIIKEGLDKAHQYLNPLPHVLMLTAIVVMVSTFGVAVAILIMLYRRYGTLEEDEIMAIIKMEKQK